MKKYEQYKPSSISWLPEIPLHWEEKRLATHFHGRVEANSDWAFKRAFKFNLGTIVPKKETGAPEEYKDVYVKYSKVIKDDILVNGLNLNYDFVSQRVAIVPEPGIVTSAYVVMRPFKTTFAPYFCYLFKAMDSQKLFHGMGTGIRLTLSFGELKKQIIPIPTEEEQKRIVAYLDEQIAIIESCKSQKEKELQNLYELKQAEIASVITLGLNPCAPMRESGIPWIGRIPAHWETKRAKYMFNKEKRDVRPEDKVVTCFRDGQVTLRENRRTTGFTESITEIGYQGIRKGDLVIHQMDAFAGSIGVSDSDGKGTSVYHCCTPKGPYVPEYYALVLREMARTGFIQSLYRGIRERSSDFNFQTFGKQYLPIPPEKEQNEIVHFIHGRTAKIDKMIAALNDEIDYLVEYKQRLILDVVTGQVNVQ